MFVGGSVCTPPIQRGTVLSFLSAQPRCPDPAGKIAVCAELCYIDGDCPYGQKCYFNGCGHQCMATTP
ncbi:hypothetical protein XENOCAPTIV_025491, partial [Xenoophorus captivus]